MISVQRSVMNDLCMGVCSAVFHSLDSMVWSPSGSSVHEISQARIPERVAISFSRGSSRPRDLCVLSRFSGVRLFETLWTVAHQVPLSIELSRKEHWSGLPFPSPGDLRPRDQTHVSCISCNGKQILYHCTTWEAPPQAG